MKPLLFALPGNEITAGLLEKELDAEMGKAEIRRFPDGETYVRILQDVSGREIILVCTLNAPDDKWLPLSFLSRTARDLGAVRVGLVAPYLAYMRQDTRFKEGEAVTSTYFAKMVSGISDWMVTIDPHLHRRSDLAEIYTIPAKAMHAAPLIAEWIARHVTSPLLIGPDSESEQWVSEVAKLASAPHLVLAKTRRGDRDVEVSVPDVEKWQDRTPVLVDDIISTARTMIETVGHLKKAGLRPPVCIGVHAVFAGTAHQDLVEAGAAEVVTCNTIPHRTNGIDVAPLLAEGIREMRKKTHDIILPPSR